MNELGWIEFLKRISRSSRPGLSGIGDDCAVIRSGEGFFLLSSDLFVEGVHFKKDKNPGFRVLGKRAAARALSDIVACAGIPRFLGVSAGVPEHLKDRDLKDLFLGIRDYCRRYGVNIIGGDTSRSGNLFLDLWVVGQSDRYILRGGARKGDYIFVTGKLGCLGFDRAFSLRVREIQSLVKNYKITSMIDISDGFALDMWRVLKASGKGALINEESLPLSEGIGDIYRGEDYELIFTVSSREDISVLEKKYFLVGRIKDKKFGYKISCEGKKPRNLPVKGYCHF